jgi:NDP-sugar pyrophosphorylase family protein
VGLLSLLLERPDEPLIMMNGDLLTKLNFAHSLDRHCDQNTEVSVCLRKHGT